MIATPGQASFKDLGRQEAGGTLIKWLPQGRLECVGKESSGNPEADSSGVY